MLLWLEFSTFNWAFLMGGLPGDHGAFALHPAHQAGHPIVGLV
jgi:hypothetical protein